MAKKKSSEKNIIEEVVEGVEEIADEVKDSLHIDNVEEGIEDIEQAESESTTKEVEISDKKKALLEKAKKLAEKLDSTSSEDLKEQVKAKKRAEMLVPLEEYVKSGIYLGTRVVTPDMKPFVYRRRADGLAIFNTDVIDERLKIGIEYLSKFNPEEIILVCKRQAGWKAAQMFSDITGIRVFTKKYPAGILTNTQLKDFFENELTVIMDHWLDKNALKDTLDIKKKVLMVCDTNNFSKGADEFIIGNNKSQRSLGLIFYLLAKGYVKSKKIDKEIPDLEWWTGEKEEEEAAKKLSKNKVGAQLGV